MPNKIKIPDPVKNFRDAAPDCCNSCKHLAFLYIPTSFHHDPNEFYNHEVIVCTLDPAVEFDPMWDSGDTRAWYMICDSFERGGDEESTYNPEEDEDVKIYRRARKVLEETGLLDGKYDVFAAIEKARKETKDA